MISHPFRQLFVPADLPERAEVSPGSERWYRLSAGLLEWIVLQQQRSLRKSELQNGGSDEGFNVFHDFIPLGR